MARAVLLGVDCLTGRNRRTALVEVHAALAARSGRSWPAGRSVSNGPPLTPGDARSYKHRDVIVLRAAAGEQEETLNVERLVPGAPVGAAARDLGTPFVERSVTAGDRLRLNWIGPRERSATAEQELIAMADTATRIA